LSIDDNLVVLFITLYDLFKREDNITFLKIPADKYPKVQKLMEIFNIRTLSKSVSISLVEQEMKSCSNDIVETIKSYADYILRYLYRFDQESYEYVKNNGIINKLNQIACYESDSIYVDYELNGITKVTDKPVLFFDGNIYIEEGYSNDVERIVMEISQLFKTKTMLDDFILALLHSNDRIDDYLLLKNITELPKSEYEIFGDSLTSIPITNDGGISEKHIDNGHDEWTPDISILQAPVKMERFIPAPKNPIDNGSSIIDSDNMKGQKMGYNLSSKDKKKIGLFGEEYAIKCLKNHYHKKYPNSKSLVKGNDYIFSIDGADIVKMTWLNQDSDIGIGHDIKIVENGVDKYFEVKSTTTNNEEWLDVSSKQWACAKKYGSHYHILRVYNAGSKNMSIKVISDPYKLTMEERIISKPFNVKLKL
jgi:hypothetical protein